MANIVKRATVTALTEPSHPSPKDTLPQRLHRGEGLVVESQVSLGLEPRLRVAWRVIGNLWAKGHSLMVFHSQSGFSPEKYPEDLNKHGRLIIETVQNSAIEQLAEEGTHFFTFVLHKKCFLGLAEKMSIVRFSEHIPSAKVGLSRIKDRLDLRTLLQRYALDDLEHEAKLNETQVRLIRSRRQLADATQPPIAHKHSERDGIVANELAAIDAMLDTYIAKREKLQALKRDPKFKKLSPTERGEIIETIERRLDAAEVSARRETRG